MLEKGKVIVEKCVKSLESSLKIEGFITENHGKIIADWINRGEQIDLEVKELQSEAREEAMKGGVSLANWFKGLEEKKKIIATRFNVNFKRELSTIAKEFDTDSSKTNGLESLKFENGESLDKDSPSQLTPEDIADIEKLEKEQND